MTWVCAFSEIYGNWRSPGLVIEQAMIVENKLPRFRDALTLSALLLVLPAVYPAQEADRFQLSLPALQAARLIDVEPQVGPQPPCGTEPIPPYAGLDDLANVKSWSKPDFGRDWKPPACTGWAEVGFTTLVTIAARFPHTSEAGGLFRQIGAISKLSGMHYWSTTHKQWRTLIVDAYALTGLPPAKRREDFTADELKQGAALFYQQVDNLSGKGIYRMHIAEASAERLVFDIENVSTMRYLLVPILHPAEMQSIYFLDRESENVWRYYSTVRIGRDASQLAGNESS